MASKIKVDELETVSGSGNIVLNNPLSGSGASLTNLPAGNLTGSLPAIDGNALVGVSPRNFIIDGAHTQWPEGTGATAFSDDYQAGGHPLFIHYNITGTGTLTTERSTDVPTVSASGYQSKYSQLIKCTGTDAVPDTSIQVSMRYHMTGTDFAHLHQQEITVSFWAKTSAQNSGHKYFWTLINSGNNRTYSHSFSPTSTWAKFSHTLTLDTSGTWLFTEADVGMKFQINLAIGPEYDDATEDTWTAGFELHDGTMSNFTDHTSNEFYFTQIQIVKGSSSPDFTSPPIATVKDQVRYYVEEKLQGDADQFIGAGLFISTTVLRVPVHYVRKRVTPTITNQGTGTNYAIVWQGHENNATNTFTISNVGPTCCDLRMTISGATTTQGYAGIQRSNNASAFVLIDARH